MAVAASAIGADRGAVFAMRRWRPEGHVCFYLLAVPRERPTVAIIMKIMIRAGCV